ncbi:unnamed protein product [Leuciscus chuanchicus]
MESDMKDTLLRLLSEKDPSVVLTNISGRSEITKKCRRVEKDGVKTPYASCKTCRQMIKYHSNSGTSGLQRHTCKASSSRQPAISSFIKRKGRGFIEVAKELINIGAKYGSSVEVEDVLPSARTVSRHVEDEYEKVKKHVIDELKQCPDWAVTTDLWAEERTNTHYITVTVHYILGWKLLNRVLATREIMGVKTHDNIRRTVESIFQEFGILSKDVVVVTDNGSNVVTAFKDYTRLSCAGHNINLILKYTFDHLDVENPLHSPVINLFRDVKTLVTHFKRAGDALRSGKLHEVLLHRNELRYVNNIDPDLLEDIIRLLEPFDEATRHLSTDQTPSLHLVLLTKATLLRGLLLQDGDSVIIVKEESSSEDLGNTYESWSRKLVLKYMNEPTKMTGGQSLLNFWQEKSGGLVPVARKLLAIPATSTPSERSFSVAGRLIEERRTSLSPECVDTLLFLHSNS